MPYHIVEARYVTGHVVWLRFRDGTEGQVDLAAELVGPVFEGLRDPREFARVRLHPQFHTIVWPNGADIAPEHLHRRVRAAA